MKYIIIFVGLIVIVGGGLFSYNNSYKKTALTPTTTINQDTIVETSGVVGVVEQSKKISTSSADINKNGTPSQVNSNQIIIANNKKRAVSIYSSSTLGIEFTYPKDWGDVVVKNIYSKNSDITITCENIPTMRTYSPYQVLSKDSYELSFSTLPTVENTRLQGRFVIQRFDEKTGLLVLCEQGSLASTINLKKDAEYIKNLPASSTEYSYIVNTFYNNNRAKVYYRPELSPGAGSQIDQYYKIYGPSTRVEAGLSYIPSYGIDKNFSGEILKWYSEDTGKVSSEVRAAFEDFHNIVIVSFKFI